MFLLQYSSITKVPKLVWYELKDHIKKLKFTITFTKVIVDKKYHWHTLPFDNTNIRICTSLNIY